jgi:hypothetical protein
MPSRVCLPFHTGLWRFYTENKTGPRPNKHTTIWWPKRARKSKSYTWMRWQRAVMLERRTKWGGHWWRRASLGLSWEGQVGMLLESEISARKWCQDEARETNCFYILKIYFLKLLLLLLFLIKLYFYIFRS